MANFIPCKNVVQELRNALRDRTPPVRFNLSSPFESVNLSPGNLVILAGRPGVGKTAAILQLTCELLRWNPEVRVVMANAEMPPLLLLKRMLSRLSGINYTTVKNHDFKPDQESRLEIGFNSLDTFIDRLAFLGPPFSLTNLFASANEIKAKVLVVDYLQRFTVHDGQSSKDERQELNELLSTLRAACFEGASVLAASALSRGGSATGSTYENASMASLRGSAELEFGADQIYLLKSDRETDNVTFENPKNRDEKPEDIETIFNGSVQSFKALDTLEAFDAAPAKNRKKKG